jgi:hypothetical protein
MPAAGCCPKMPEMADSVANWRFSPASMVCTVVSIRVISSSQESHCRCSSAVSARFSSNAFSPISLHFSQQEARWSRIRLKSAVCSLMVGFFLSVLLADWVVGTGG